MHAYNDLPLFYPLDKLNYIQEFVYYIIIQLGDKQRVLEIDLLCIKTVLEIYLLPRSYKTVNVHICVHK